MSSRSNRFGHDFDFDDEPQPRSRIPARAAAPKAKKPKYLTKAARKFARDNNLILPRSLERPRTELEKLKAKYPDYHWAHYRDQD